MGWIHVEKKAEKSRDAATLTQCQIVATVVSHDVPSSVLHTHSWSSESIQSCPPPMRDTVMITA